VTLVRHGTRVSADQLIAQFLSQRDFLLLPNLQYSVRFGDVDLAFEAHLRVNALDYLPEAVELVEAVLKHFKRQHHLVYILVQSQHVVCAPRRALQSLRSLLKTALLAPCFEKWVPRIASALF